MIFFLAVFWSLAGISANYNRGSLDATEGTIVRWILPQVVVATWLEITEMDHSSFLQERVLLFFFAIIYLCTVLFSCCVVLRMLKVALSLYNVSAAWLTGETILFFLALGWMVFSTCRRAFRRAKTKFDPIEV